MHLSDEQLLELDESGKIHLMSCEQCRERAAEVLHIRAQLGQLNTVPAPQQSWLAIKADYQSQQRQQQQQQADKKLAFWRISSFALAASLAAVLIWQWPQLLERKGQPGSEAIQMASLIDQNRLLQQQLNQQLVTRTLTSSANKQLQIALAAIDRALQQAYLQNASEEDKAALWLQRQKIIQESLKTPHNNQIIRI